MILYADTPDALHKWLKSATPGATRVYFMGDLASARQLSFEADEIACLTYSLSCRGEVSLVQRVLPPSRVSAGRVFEYLIVKRRFKAKQSTGA